MPEKTRNLFLSSLSAAARELIESRTTPIALKQKTRLYRPEQRPPYAYLMTSGIASVVTEMSDGTSAEVGMIGREGIVGALHILGPVAAPTHCFIQMEGTALRIRLAELRSLFESSKEIREGILKLVQKEAMVLSQVAGCHRLHSAEERLARWLLMAQDQTQTDDLHFTQALLANMLGARRATVSLIAGELQREGLIRYHRGHVHILSREGMEEAACDCYQVIKEIRGDLYRIK
jgi:CRP-like cAMP-binding protein